MKRMLWCVLAILAGTAGAAAGQEGAAGGPMTYALARKANYVPLETLRETGSRMPAPLARRVSIERNGVLLQQVLLDIANQAELGLSYGEDLVRARVAVSLTVQNETAADALQQVTDGTDWAVLVTPAGQVAVLRREPAQVGAIVGSVADKKTEASLAGATVVVEGTSLSAATGTDGRYRIGNVAPGTYTVRARYIGYAPGTASVTVSADQEATADFALAKSVQRLDEVVTTGTVVPTEVKALPTPISVITAADIEAQHVTRTDQLFRQSVPSAIAWDEATDPEAMVMTVRGAASASQGTGVVKLYLDGVEISSRVFNAIDPNSIERIEVVRGPQAATIYGSEAIGGVMQVFTKHGDARLTRPQVDLQAAVGSVESPYGEFGGGTALRQQYTGSVQGGGPTMSYNVGGGYSKVGDWLPQVGQSLPSAYGGMHVNQGPLAVDLSARYYAQHQETEFDPRVAGTGLSFFSVPLYDPEDNQEQTYGARLAYAPSSWWRHNLTVGLDRLLIDIPQSRARLTTPDDTLLSVYNQTSSKTSIAYNTSVVVPLDRSVSATVTAGLDHYLFRRNQYSVSGSLNTTGNIRTIPDVSFQSVAREITTNTGYFAQAQFNIRDVIFLTGGIRAEQNSNFGEALGTPISPRAGLSFVRQVGQATLKVRGSYGEAIRPPTSGQRDALVSPSSVVLANPTLAPERQRGWDTGVDVVFGSRGSLGVTYYNQIARDAIQFVSVGAGQQPPVGQYQNVGRVKNTGVEFEGTLSVGPAELRAQYAITRSRPEDLGPTFSGDLRVGEQVIGFPEHTGGASMTVSPLVGTSISAGLTYVGSWTNYDYIAEFSCFGGTKACPSAFLESGSTRAFLTTYPGFVKLNLSINQQIRRGVTGFVSVSNLTNNDAFELSNLVVVMGRVTMVGLHVRY
jgi:outer membrane receptor protein involved in Fe transport